MNCHIQTLDLHLLAYNQLLSFPLLSSLLFMLILIHLYPSLFHPCLLAYKQPIPYFFFPFEASVSTSIPHFDISGAT